MSESSSGPPAREPNRRARRRQETIEEILAIAEQIMAEDGVNALTLSEIARRLGVQPPSLYKYFDSLTAIYDTLFRRGQAAHLDTLSSAMAAAAAGLPALHAGLEASGRWCLAHQPIAQLMFWRPVPHFEPTDAAMAPSLEMVRLQRRALADAVTKGELGPGADSSDAVLVVSILISGTIGQAISNEPRSAWGKGRFSRQFPTLLDTLPALYPPTPAGGT
jgi:AcrR family transcriptional regulator